MGQLPAVRITPDIVFEHVGLDYAGPLHLKRGTVHKPIIVKCYVCVFVSMSVKAVHLERKGTVSVSKHCWKTFLSPN